MDNQIDTNNICLDQVPPDRMKYMPIKLKKIFDLQDSSILLRCEGLKTPIDTTDFEENLLSQMFVEPGEESKCGFLIVVAMYNESSCHFNNTMSGISENLEQFNAQSVPVTCIIIVDGMTPFLKIYNENIGFYSQFFDKPAVEERYGPDLEKIDFGSTDPNDELAHCFIQKYRFATCQYSLNLVFCVKQQNKRKLNTHLWFFGGFCEMLQPKYVMLIDIGTKPLSGSLYYLYDAMEKDEQIAGCCGEIRPIEYDIWKMVIPAQFVEYKFSHMLDKALESVIGYITVLPGAFSAYRWEALQGAPLWDDYFKSICRPKQMNAFMSNIYLAEDRVLCLSLVSKKNQKYLLRYVKASVAETDVPSTLSELMAQRRRWNNGSMFALIDAVWNCKKIYQSDHHIYRKFLFTLQMIYYSLTILYSWFIVGAFCLTLAVSIRKNNEGSTNSSTFGSALLILYVTILLVLLTTSLSVKPKSIEDFYKAIAVLFALYQFYTFYLVGKFLWNKNINHNAEQVVFVLLGIAASFALIVIVNCEIWTILKGTLHYIFMIPTYVNIFLIYSICNIHDCTWGNRPDQLTKEEMNRLEDFQEFRTKCTIFWVICNSGFVYLMNMFSKSDTIYSFYFISGIAAAGAAILVIRVIGGLLYLCIERYKKPSITETRAERIPTGNNADIHMPYLNRRRETQIGTCKKTYFEIDRTFIQINDESQDDSIRREEKKIHGIELQHFGVSKDQIKFNTEGQHEEDKEQDSDEEIKPIINVNTERISRTGTRFGNVYDIITDRAELD